jgi:ATP-dependent DNA helicase RecQ
MLYQQKDIEDLKEAALLKFPDLPTIRGVYQAVANYLQIPTGLGEGSYYSFDIIDFAKKFQLDLILAINSLKVLEQEGYVSFNEQVFVPSKIQFVCNKDTLYEFESSYPALEPFIKALLRNYEGIFDYPVSVYERSVAFILKKTVEEVKDAFMQLDRYRIIEYDVQKDSPQLYFIYERVAAQSVVIDQKQFDFRKEEYEKRLKHFIDYVLEPTACRSQIIGRYFGDENMKECGVCDNCLKKKRAVLSDEEFEKIKSRIFEIITTDEVDIKKLMSKLSGISKEKAWKVIDFLQSEGKIATAKEGLIYKG